MAISKAKREKVLSKSGGVCWYCGCELSGKWHVDHVKAVYRNTCLEKGMEKPENDTVENMVPACIPCNLFKKVYSVEQFREEIRLQVERARNFSVNFRNAERFGLIQETTQPVTFWFERNL